MDNQELPIVAATRDGLTRYADFSGVSTRSQYWYFTLALFLATLVLQFAAGDLVTNIFTFLTILPSLAVSIRRMHDIGKSGWWILISLIPIAGPIWALVLLCTDSNPGQNMYGPNPKDAVATAVPPTSPTQN